MWQAVHKGAKDISKDNPPEIKAGFSGIILAYSVEQKEDVNKITEYCMIAPEGM